MSLVLLTNGFKVSCSYYVSVAASMLGTPLAKSARGSEEEGAGNKRFRRSLFIDAAV